MEQTQRTFQGISNFFRNFLCGSSDPSKLDRRRIDFERCGGRRVPLSHAGIEQGLAGFPPTPTEFLPPKYIAPSEN